MKRIWFKMKAFKIYRSITWSQWLWTVNFTLIAITVVYFWFPAFPQKWRFITPFNLILEMNFGVWWSGILIAISGFIAYEFFQDQKEKEKYAWLVIAVSMFGLSLDEIGST